VRAAGGCPWDAATAATVRRFDSQGTPLLTVGWSPDGQAIAWGTKTENLTTDGTAGTLERTFCLRTLDFGPPPDKTYLRARPQLGQVNFRTSGPIFGQVVE